MIVAKFENVMKFKKYSCWEFQKLQLLGMNKGRIKKY